MVNLRFFSLLTALRTISSFVVSVLGVSVFSVCLQAQPVISEVCWMGSESSAADEWIEIANYSGEDIVDLSMWSLVESAGEHVLPPIALANQSVIVIEKRELSISNQDYPVLAFTLSNGGEQLMLCPVGWSAVEQCDIANPEGNAWFAGDRSPRRTMQRNDVFISGAVAENWHSSTQTSTVALDSMSVAVPGNPGTWILFELDSGVADSGVADSGVADSGVADSGNTISDAGENSDGGDLDLNPVNHPPRIDVLEFKQSSERDQLQITYKFSDIDVEDFHELRLFYSQDNDGFDGIEIVRSISQKRGQYLWNTEFLAAGKYYIFAVVSDRSGAKDALYAAGLYLKEGAAAEIFLKLNMASKTGYIGEDVELSIESNIENEDYNLSLYLDLNDAGIDGELLKKELQFKNGVIEYSWKTDDLKAGKYFVYALLEWDDGRSLVQYSAVLDLQAQNCTCAEASGNTKGKFTFFAILFIFFTRRLIRREV